MRTPFLLLWRLYNENDAYWLKSESISTVAWLPTVTAVFVFAYPFLIDWQGGNVKRFHTTWPCILVDNPGKLNYDWVFRLIFCLILIAYYLVSSSVPIFIYSHIFRWPWCNGHGMGLSIERSRVRFPADCSGVRKGIRPQMLLCHTSIQVRRFALILEIKNQVTSRFLTEYHRVSRL